MRLKTWIVGLLLAFSVAFGSVAALAADDPPTPPGCEVVPPAASGAAPIYADRGAETCTKCHDTDRMAVANSIVLKGPHAMKGDSRTPFAKHECESCHGASPQHTQKPAPGKQRACPTVVFKGPHISPVQERNKVCVECHESGLRMNWKGSQHEFGEVACTNCHSVHVVKDPVLVKKSQPDVCFNCHVEQRAQTLKPSHHPIREGKVSCSECHNPHGSVGPKMLKEASLNATCYNCHAEKRGPFLWEHSPAFEDCSICHTPHGSSNQRLLKQRPPWLCEECHSFSGHPAGVYAGNYNATNWGTNTSAKRMMVRACLNCHTEVHGSNHPSGVRKVR